MDCERKVINGTMMQYFHWYLPDDGTLWNKLSHEAKNLSDIGITSVWLPPAYKGTCSGDVGYGVYDLYDLGEFNQKGTVRTKYGTKDEYLNAIRVLHENNIDVYADVSFEHRMGADETEEVEVVEAAFDNRQYDISGTEVIEAWTKFTFPGRKNKYSSFIWNKSCFDGVDYDNKTGRRAIFRFKNKHWAQCVASENGNYDFLMGADVDFSVPWVVDELDRWGEWYVNFAQLDGFRVDAVKHFSCIEMTHWITNLRNKTGKELFTVSEYWNGDVNLLSEYIIDTMCKVSLFDVPLHYNFHMASKSNDNYDMRNILKGTLMERNPMNAVTFVDNHDTQKGQSLESYIHNWFKPIAYSIILLRNEGYPCIFYADYYGDGKEISIPSMEDKIKILLKVRKEKSYGQQHDYFNHNNIIGWTREGDIDHEGAGLAVIASNSLFGAKDMYVGKHLAGETFYDALCNRMEKVTINSNGFGCFLVNSRSVSVWIRENKFGNGR